MAFREELKELAGKASKEILDKKTADQKILDKETDEDIKCLLINLPGYFRKAAADGKHSLAILILSEEKHLLCKESEIADRLESKNDLRKILRQPLIQLLDYLEKENLGVSIEKSVTEGGLAPRWGEHKLVVSWD